MVERSPHHPMVKGLSLPTFTTTMREKTAGTVAQLVERSTNDPKLEGSNPAPAFTCGPKCFMNQALAKVIKLFTAVIYELLHKLVFFPGKPFKLSQLFVNKAVAYPSEAPLSGSTHKYRSTLVNYISKKFCNIGQGYK